MADAAFKTAPFSGYTTAQLESGLAYDHDMPEAKRAAMLGEIQRRRAVEAGDWSAMTFGEKLRHNENVRTYRDLPACISRHDDPRWNDD